MIFCVVNTGSACRTGYRLMKVPWTSDLPRLTAAFLAQKPGWRHTSALPVEKHLRVYKKIGRFQGLVRSLLDNVFVQSETTTAQDSIRSHFRSGALHASVNLRIRLTGIFPVVCVVMMFRGMVMKPVPSCDSSRQLVSQASTGSSRIQNPCLGIRATIFTLRIRGTRDVSDTRFSLLFFLMLPKGKC